MDRIDFEYQLIVYDTLMNELGKAFYDHRDKIKIIGYANERRPEMKCGHSRCCMRFFTLLFNIRSGFDSFRYFMNDK